MNKKYGDIIKNNLLKKLHIKFYKNFIIKYPKGNFFNIMKLTVN